MTPARFPISGPIENPTASDYRLEAALLRREGAATHRPGSYGASARYYDVARRFDAVARRKAFLEQQSSHQVKTQEVA